MQTGDDFRSEYFEEDVCSLQTTALGSVSYLSRRKPKTSFSPSNLILAGVYHGKIFARALIVYEGSNTLA